jgi:TRAP-type C4-dicarboxylate transport system permease small subunit
MKHAGRAYDALLYGMAALAGALMACMMLAITVDVILRNLGFQSSAHLFTFTEYALLIVPCLGAPWLVREKGHVYVEILLMAMTPAVRQRWAVGIGVACVAVCLVLAWYGVSVTWRNFSLNDIDVRSMDMPRWMIVIFIPLAFLMMAVEFARFLWRGEDFLGALGGQAGDQG